MNAESQFAVLTFVISVAVYDLMRRRISHWYTGSATLLFLAYHSVNGGLTSALLAAAFGWTAGMLLFGLSGIGGGDVMLFTAMGAGLGLDLWFRALAFTLILAGLLSLIVVLQRRVFRRTIANMGLVVRHLARAGWTPHPEINLAGMPDGVRIPLGLPAALATLVVVLWL